VELLFPARSLAQLPFGARCQKVARRHAESIREEVRDAQNDHDSRLEPRSCYPCDNCECRHRTVHSPIHEVAEVLGRTHFCESFAYRAFGVLRPKALDYTLAMAHELRLAFAGGAR